jgi:hypothetical protein
MLVSSLITFNMKTVLALAAVGACSAFAPTPFMGAQVTMAAPKVKKTQTMKQSRCHAAHPNTAAAHAVAPID